MHQTLHRHSNTILNIKASAEQCVSHNSGMHGSFCFEEIRTQLPNHMKTTATLQKMNRLLLCCKSIQIRLLNLLLLVSFLSVAQSAIGQTTYTSVGTGNWSTMTWSPVGTPGPGDDVIINTAVTANVAVIVNNLTVNASRTLTLNVADFTVNGTSNLSGIITDNNAGGTNWFKGALTVNVGGTFTTAAASNYVFGGSITNNGTFNKASTGSSTLDATMSISGSSPLIFNGGVTISNDAVVTNTTTVTISAGVLNGSNAGSSWVNGPSSSLTYNNLIAPMASGSFIADGAGSTVNYNGGSSQNVRDGAYHNLLLSSGTPKIVPDVSIAGNLTRTGVAMTFTGTTVTFNGTSNSTFTFSGSQVFPNVIINKPGASLTFVPSTTAHTTTFGSLTVASGTLNLGTTNTSLLVQEDLSGAGEINVTGATHTVTLGGANNAIGLYTASASTGSSTVAYNRAGDQTLFQSLNYKSITLQGSGDKTLSGPTVCDGVLNFATAVKLILGANDIKMRSNATLTPSTGWGASRMFVTDGAGKLIKEGTNIAQFTTNLPAGRFPVGSNGFYTPVTLTSLSCSIVGTAAILVRAVPTRQPNVPYFNNALIKYWDLESSNMSGIAANISFSFNAAEVIGSVVLYSPRVWNGSSLSAVAGPSTPGSNPCFTTGSTFLTGQWTAMDPTVRTSLYSYQSGDWADANTWTTDPSGSTLVSPIVPGPGDQVVILNGRTVSTSIARTVGSLTIQNGGTLDIGATSGSNFGTVDGSGLLKLSSINFPSGSFSQFVGSTGGTVEYYNLPAGVNTISTLATYNNLVFSNSTATSYIATSNNNNLTLNGNLTLLSTASGMPTFKIGSTTGNRILNVLGDVTIGVNTTLGVSSYNGAHTFNIYGNLTANGNLTLQNGAAYTAASNGRATLYFLGATQNTVANFGPSANATLYDVKVNKNEGYEVFISASPSSVVNFYGAGATVEPLVGTMRLGQNINIPVLNSPNGGNYDLGAPGVLPVLWIDGATVSDGGVTGAIVPYGTIKITAGTLNVINGQRAIVIRESGLLKIEGGVVNMGMFRTSVTAVTHRGSFDMSGGTLNLQGNGTVNYYSVFSLAYPENVFTMTGGTINITKTATGGITPNGGIMIASLPQNYSVTGGTVNASITGNVDFDISSSAPFYNFNVTKASAGSGSMRLNDIDWSYDGSNGNRATINAQPLVVLNNMTIASANSPTFNTTDQDVKVGGNLTVNTGATYASGSNTLNFNGNSTQTFTIDGNLTYAASGGASFINGPENIVPGSNYTMENLTSTPNVEVAPNSTMTAERLNESSNNGIHRFYTPFIPTSGSVTASIHVKANGRNCVSLQVGDFGSLGIARFNITGGGSVTSTNVRITNATITALPNGWYRITATSLGVSTYRMRLYLGDGSCNDSYAGNTSLGIYAWGAKVESGSVATPYVSSTGVGVNSLEVNKADGSVLMLAGSATTIGIGANLRVNSGNFNIASKTVNVSANIVNNTQITGSGSSKLRLNGATTQSIFGDGDASFYNLSLDNSGGVAGDAQVSMLSNFIIENQLELISNRVFFIDNNRITLPATASIVATSGAFSATKFIQTQGFLSDGGISKTYSSTAQTFTFPFGSGTNYTPATIAFTSAPTTWGTLNMRPVAAQQLYVTDPNALNYYWKASTSGFTGIAANSLNMSFNYGNLPDNVAFIPGYYNFQDIAYTTINDVNAVDEVTNVISFNNFSRLDGDFTAGVPAAFGAVIPYYSRANGNWNSPSTWSNNPTLKHAGAASASIPTSSVPVFIGDGTTYFHTVTVTSNNTLAGSLIIDAGATLDLGVTTGNNFGALPYSTAGGAGKLRISSALSAAEFPAGDFGLFFTSTGGTTEYYGMSTSFSTPLNTAAPTNMQIRTYRKLNLNPSVSGTITLADRDIEIFENLTVNGASTALAKFSDVDNRTTTVRGNLTVTSGNLQFGSDFSQNLLVDGDISVGNAGTFSVANSGSIAHSISLLGNLTNNGTINFNQASDVDISFIGATSRSLTGTNGAAVTNLNKLILNKGTSQVILLNVDVAGTLTTPTNDWLNLLNGTFRLSRAGTITLSSAVGFDFFVPVTSAISLNHIGAIVNAATAADDDADFVLAGKLEILNGTMNIGNNANNNHNDIEYSPTNIPEINVSGTGTLNVNGQIRRSTSVLLGSLSYTQTGNSTVLVRGKNAEGASSFNLNRAKFEVLNTGSQFTMANNALLIIDRNGVSSGIYGDLYLNPSSSSVTGGEVRFGTANTLPSSSTFAVNSLVPFWDFTVDGTVTSKTAIIQGNPVNIQNNLSILNSSVFNTSGLNVTIGGGFINQNPNAAAGLTNGGYQAINSSQITTFTGLATSPSITGASGNLTNFSNVVLSNAFLGGSYNLSANTNIRINGNLSILNGTLNGSTNTITLIGNVLNNKFHTSVSPGYLVLAGATTQTISGNGSGQFGNIKINNAAGIDLAAPITINGDLNFVAGLFYINNNLLTLGTTATATGVLNQSSMIRLNGVLSDAGVKKLYPASSHDFTFPIGVTLKYTPARINVTSNSVAGEVTIKPVNIKHPATTDVSNLELGYYWNTSATGFSATPTLTHTYTYIDADASFGNETLYRTGRYFNNIWVPQFGIPGSVNAAANTMTLTGVNYFNGDYTAGEQTEFDQLLVYYSRNATLGGTWSDPNSWSTDAILMHAGAPATSAPTFNSVVIASGHTINIISDNRSAATAQVDGLLNLNSTIGHNLGSVSGVGTIKMNPTVSNQYIFPGGNFASFVVAGGGTVEYNSTATSTLPSQGTYNNLLFSGTGTKNLFNTDLVINGNLTIQAGIISNVSNRNISLKGNLTNNSGISGFVTGTGIVTLSGGAQSITGSTSFYRLTINGTGDKTLNSSIIVANQLSLTQGVVVTGSNVLSTLASATVIGGSNVSYVNGNLQKYISTATSSKSFEIGDATSYAPMTMLFSGTTNGIGSITGYTLAGDHPNAATSGIDPSKSVNRNWGIQNSGVTGFTSVNVQFNFNTSDIDLGVNTSNLNISRYASSSWTAHTVGVRTANSTQVTGLTTFGEFQLAEPFSAGITWTGAVNSDWNNPGNWNPNIIPGGSDNISIPVRPNQPTFLSPGNGLVRSVVMSSGATLTIPTGYKVTVNGSWTGTSCNVNGPGNVEFTSPTAQNSGNTVFGGVVSVITGAVLNTDNTLTLASGASLMHGVGTLGAGGSVSGNVIIRRTGNSGSTSYNYWSSPINSASLGLLGGNKYKYDPSAATGTDVDGLRAGWIGAGSTMTIGRGYIATGTGTATFTGVPNNGPISFGPLTLATHTNFNLIGNPYPSAISASSFVSANPQLLGGALYFWDDDNSAGDDYAQTDYGVWNGIGFVGPNSGATFNGNIASAQGFFVEASNSSSANFSNSMRTTQNNNFFEIESIERVWVNISTPEGNYNEILLAFKEDATEGVDNAYDAKKLRGNDQLSMYSRIGDGDYAIQALPELNMDRAIQIGVEGIAGNQTFSLKTIDGISETAQIILEDTKLGSFHNLRSVQSYSYDFNPQTDQFRFKLHFKPEVEFTTSTESCVQNDGELIIHSPSATTWNYVVSNSAGQTIDSGADFSGDLSIGNLDGGVYTIALSNVFGTQLHQAVEIASGAPVLATIIASANQVDVNDGFVQFSAQVQGASDITWDFGDGSIVTGVMTPAHIYTLPGTYTVTFIASNVTCMDVQTMEITVKDISAGIANTDSRVFSMYPNPANNTASIRIDLPQTESLISVFVIDAAGKLIKTEVFSQVDKSGVLTLDVSTLAAGVYQILLSGEKISSSSRLTISR
jgi:hypothetical protein